MSLAAKAFGAESETTTSVARRETNTFFHENPPYEKVIRQRIKRKKYIIFFINIINIFGSFRRLPAAETKKRLYRSVAVCRPLAGTGGNRTHRRRDAPP